MKRVFLFVFAFSSLLSLFSHAKREPLFSENSIWVDKNASCSLRPLYGKGFYFADELGNLITDFSVQSDAEYPYFFVFNANMTVNLLYAVTCVLQGESFQVAPSVSFIVGPDPMLPVVSVNAFDGATGSWEEISSLPAGVELGIHFPTR